MTDPAFDILLEPPTAPAASSREDPPRCAVIAFEEARAQMTAKLRALLRRDPDTVLVVVAHENGIDPTQAVDLMRAGAFDVLIQPLVAGDFAERLALADTEARRRAGHRHARETAAALLERLTPRERDVVVELVAGASNKVAARHLGLSPRTIEFHRARIFEKLEISGVAALTRIALLARLELDWRAALETAA